MNLNWSGEEYEMFLASPREHQLVRDAIVEAGYVVGGLPDADWVARLGRTKVEVEDFLKAGASSFPPGTSRWPTWNSSDRASRRRWNSSPMRNIKCG